MISIKTADEIEALRRSASLLVEAFRAVEAVLEPGVSTARLDEAAHDAIVLGGGVPAFKGYNGYPASVCVSIDEQVVHGIPGPRRLRAGDIVGLDIGVNREGLYTDAAKSYAVGDVGPDKRRLLETTRRALHEGLRQCRAGRRIGDISHAVQRCVEAAGYSVVRELVGHGIGRALHEEPQIPNFGSPQRGPKLRPGMVFAIEPMVNLGTGAVRILEDGWTVVTGDGDPSAHFEHTVLVTEGAPEVLTLGIEENGSERFHG